jgi:hypothetical protein
MLDENDEDADLTGAVTKKAFDVRDAVVNSIR